MIFPQNFAATYKEARQKYLDAARDATLFVHHINPKATGLLGEELATDAAGFGEHDAANLLIICSGTPGN